VCLVGLRGGASLINLGAAVQWRNILGLPPQPKMTSAGSVACKRLQAMSRAVDSAHFERWWRSTLRASSIDRSLPPRSSMFNMASSVADCSRALGGPQAIMLSSPVAAPHSPPAELLLWPSACMPATWCTYSGVRTARFVIMLPYPSVVTSLHILSPDSSLSVVGMEVGVMFDDLQSCSFDTSVSIRRKKAASPLSRPSFMQQEQPAAAAACSLYTVTLHQPQNCLVLHLRFPVSLCYSNWCAGRRLRCCNAQQICQRVTYPALRCRGVGIATAGANALFVVVLSS
jgi:hypothetical protein